MNIVRISDGLGNQMFQYAFARKISILTGKKVYLDTRFINNEDEIQMGKKVYVTKKLGHRQYGLSHFKIVLQPADEKILLHWRYLQQTDYVKKILYSLSIMNKWVWQYQKEDLNFKKELSEIRLMFPTYYQGYFFDLKYYDDIKEILQNEFSLKDKIKLPNNLRTLLNSRNTISLHVRRGDFLKLNRDISRSGYYGRAIKYMENRIDKPVYLIFSDDIDWVRENVDIQGERIYVSDMGFKDYEELIIMKHCRHNIIANSTFSYWAAYLNLNVDKITICPKYWKSNIIPEKWIKL